MFQKNQQRRKKIGMLKSRANGDDSSSQLSTPTQGYSRMKSRSNSPAPPKTPVTNTSNLQKTAQKYMIDGQWIDILTDLDKGMGEPIFQKPRDTRFGIRMPQAMCHGVILPDRSSDIWFTIQVEYKKVKSKRQAKVFHAIDQLFMKIFTMALSFKLAQVQAESDYAEQSELVSKTLKLCQDICTQKTHKRLLRKIKQSIPEYFGFQDVGILLYDQKTNDLFTVSDSSSNLQTKSKQQKAKTTNKTSSSLMKAIDLKLGEKNIPTSKKVKAGELNQDEHKIVDDKQEADIPYDVKAENNLKQMILDQQSIIKFPVNLGVTGMVFQDKQQIYICNNVTKDSKFNSDIDNLSSITDIRNFMIGAMIREHDGKAIGVLQFMNKKDGTPIKEQQAENYRRMRTFLGTCCDNANLLNSTVNLTAGVKTVLEKINRNSKIEEEAQLTAESIVKVNLLEQIMSQMKETMSEQVHQREEFIKVMKK